MAQKVKPQHSSSEGNFITGGTTVEKLPREVEAKRPYHIKALSLITLIMATPIDPNGST